MVEMPNLRYDPCDAVNSGQIDLNPFLDSFLNSLTGTPRTSQSIVIESESIICFVINISLESNWFQLSK